MEPSLDIFIAPDYICYMISHKHLFEKRNNNQNQNPMMIDEKSEHNIPLMAQILEL